MSFEAVEAKPEFLAPVFDRPRGGLDCEVAVVGAGPYGLAVGAHLKAAGVEVRVFGEPMSFWRDHMPKGMRLRSPRRATTISDPRSMLTLDDYERFRNVSVGEQTPLADFVDYGSWFQANALPDLDRRLVTRIVARPFGFLLNLNDGSTVAARRVVMATELEKQEFVPPAFKSMPGERVSHVCTHRDLGVFRGKSVVVVGRGQSATESAALLHEAGVKVELLSRGPVRWLGGAKSRGPIRGWLGEAVAAPSAIGPFPLNWIAEAPKLVRLAPATTRERFTEKCLRPAAAGWLWPRLAGVPIISGRTILAAQIENAGVALQLDDGNRVYDHVLLATGYAIDVAKSGLLAPELLAMIERRNGSPILSPGFKSSVPGLHFAGASAVASFGPLMRFIAGTGFAATAIARTVVGDRSATPMQRNSARAAAA